MYPAVLERLLRRRPGIEPAILHGYRRGRVRGKSYPGITPCPDRQVNGALLSDIDRDEILLLDAFEDILYERIPVRVCSSSGQRQHAQAYCIAGRHRRQLTLDDWDAQHFHDHQLEAFVARIGNVGAR